MKTVDKGPGNDVIGLDIDDDPKEYGEIDYDIMFEKQFRAPFERLVVPIWGEGVWDELMTGMFQSGLEEFF